MDDSTPSNEMEIDAPKPLAGLAGLFEIKPLPVIAGKKDESEVPEQVFGSEAFMKGIREANVDGSGHLPPACIPGIFIVKPAPAPTVKKSNIRVSNSGLNTPKRGS
jgi:hypothetical protein